MHGETIKIKISILTYRKYFFLAVKRAPINLKELYVPMNTVCQHGYFAILGYLFCSFRKLILWAFDWINSNSIPPA